MKINTNSMKKQYEELLNTFCKKNHDYGNSFELSLDKYGLVAGVVRMEDKMNRLSTLVDSDTDAQIASESLVDTLMDLSNYAAMSACWLIHEDDDGLGDIFSKRISGSIETIASVEDFKKFVEGVLHDNSEVTTDKENTLHLSSFKDHDQKVNERAYYDRDDISDEEIIKNWGLVGDSKTVRSRTTGQYLVEDDNPELFHKILNVLKNHTFKRWTDYCVDDVKETLDSRAQYLVENTNNKFESQMESLSNVSSAFWKPAPDDIVNEPQPFKTELKGLENGYFIRQHTNHEDSYRYTIAFNPEGTIKIQNGEEKPYVIECFGNDYDGMNVWAIHVFDTLEDMVAALNYDLKVRDTFKSKNLGDSIKGLDIKTSVYAQHDAPQVFETWIEFFGWAFDNNMKCKNLFSDGLFGISQGIKTFGPVFISEKTGALVVKGLIRERFSDRNHNFIWFSDTKEVLLELKNTVPKFNHHGIIYGINSENVNNGENYDFSPLYQDMEDNILSKFHSWDGSELKNLVFFNEDEELMSEFMEKTMQIPTDLVVEKPKNTVGTGEISVFSDMESGSLSSKNGKMELDFTDSNAYWCENTNTI